MALMQVPCTKSKGTVEIDTDAIPADVYAEALLQGLKVLVNRGASKITKETYPDADELKVAAQAKAEEQKVAIMSSQIKFSGSAKVKKASGAVMTEARRLAKNLVKDEIKRKGGKISHYDAKEITKAANAYLEQDPTLIEMAQANLAERDKTDVGSKIDLSALIQPSPKRVAEAEAKKAKAKKDAPLSAKQAGMTKKQKPQQATVN